MEEDPDLELLVNEHTGVPSSSFGGVLDCKRGGLPRREKRF
jgi:hypothetical protein